MRSTDLIRFARDAATGNPLRAGLLVLAMAIGVASVVVLTALGDGARLTQSANARRSRASKRLVALSSCSVIHSAVTRSCMSRARTARPRRVA